MSESKNKKDRGREKKIRRKRDVCVSRFDKVVDLVVYLGLGTHQTNWDRILARFKPGCAEGYAAAGANWRRASGASAAKAGRPARYARSIQG